MAMRRLVIIAMAAAAIAMPAFANPYVDAFFTRILIYAIFAMSLDLILGYGGLVSLGHAAFFGAGAYATALMVLHGFSGALPALLAAVAGAAVAALLIGAMALRVRGIYFIMLTFAFAQMLFYLAIGQPQWGGDDGIALPGRLQLWFGLKLDNPPTLFYAALLLLCGALALLRQVTRAPFGLALQGCRQDETRMRTLGYPVYRIRLVAFVIAGAVAGAAGFLMVNLQAYLSPSLLDWRLSGIAMMIVVIGGVGTLFGPILGAILYLSVEELASGYSDHWLAGFGVLLVLVALFWRRGIYGLIADRLEARRVAWSRLESPKNAVG
jgi:branched-chain amino acid transport system permease protein